MVCTVWANRHGPEDQFFVARPGNIPGLEWCSSLPTLLAMHLVFYILKPCSTGAETPPSVLTGTVCCLRFGCMLV